MPEVPIVAESRTDFGKGAARRTRRAGKVPGVLYGHGENPVHISLPGHELMMALKTPNVLFSLELDGKKQLALPKDVQRDPLRRTIDHVDLLLVRRGEKVTVDVPVHVTGEVAPGGLLEHTLNSLSVLAEATHIPQSFEVDVQGLQIGDAVHAKDVTLPSGVDLAVDPEASVLHVLAAPTAEQMESEGAGEAAEAPAAEAEAPAVEVPAPAEES